MRVIAAPLADLEMIYCRADSVHTIPIVSPGYRVGMTPRALFKTFALAEVVTWAGLITAMILRGAGVTDALVPAAGGVHGFVFLAYCVATVIVWIDGRWSAGRGVLGLALSVIPFATWPFEVATDRAGLLARTWRLASEAPRTLLEHVLAWVIRHAVLAGVVLVVVVAIVFCVLLWLGPPVPRA